jgi:shikimate 5-dehydrogenase
VPDSLAWLTRPAAAVPAAAGLGNGGAGGAAAAAALGAAEEPNRLLLAARADPTTGEVRLLLPLPAAALGASGVVARRPDNAAYLQMHNR